MATNVIMPQLGESVVEGTIGKWIKRVGDPVAPYESLFEVVTDKVTTEVPSPAAGTLLQILVPEGATVNAGTLIAIIGDANETQPVLSAPPAEKSAAVASSFTSRLTPVVARMIAENNITEAELGSIKGTGDGGRISKKDVESFLKTRTQSAPNKSETLAREQPGTGELFRPTEETLGKTSISVAPIKSNDENATDEIVPLTPMRKSIADHMVRSKQVAPHVTSVHEADMSRVIAYQQAHEAEFAKQGVKLTYTAFFVQAAVAALQAFPIVNATYTDQGIHMKREINVGIAVALEDGLIVPVVKHADEKSLMGIARSVNDLATRARAKRLQPDEVQGGTFTITNYGIFGSLFGMPIINQPQSAILGVGTIQKRVVVTSAPTPGGGVNDAIAIRPMIYLSITIDHRLLDGAIGDQFMGRFKKFLEEYK